MRGDLAVTSDQWHRKEARMKGRREWKWSACEVTVAVLL